MKGRVSRVSLSALLVLIAVVAVVLAQYRQWKKYQARASVTYSVAKLYAEDGSGVVDPQPLIDEITSTVQPGNWSSVGGTGTIHFMALSRSLIIRNNIAAHEGIARLLKRKFDALEKRK